MSDIILVFPRSGMDFASAIAPPHSLLCVAAPLEKAGYKVRIIDMRTDPHWKDHLEVELETHPVFLGITCMTGHQVKYAIEVAKLARNYTVPIVWGGPHPSLLPDSVLNSGLADHVCIGEVDSTITKIASDIDHNQAAKIIKSPLPEMDSILPTPWNLIEVEKYIHPDMYVKNGRRTLDVSQTSRGCGWGKCGFCASAAIREKRWRFMSAAKSVEMISRAVKDFKLTGIWLRDDEFYTGLNRAATIAEGIIPLNIRWYTSGTKVDIFLKITNEQLKLYRRSGAHTLKFGAESGNERILNLMKKGITPEQTLRANLKCKEHGIVPAFALMCGFPTETFSEINDTIKMAKRIRNDNPQAQFETMAIYRADPGTSMLSLAEAHGLVLPTTLEGWSDWVADEYDPEGKRIPWFNPSERRSLGNLCYLSMLSNAMPNVLDSLENVTEAKLLKMVYAIPHKYFEWSFFNGHYKFHPELPLIREARKRIFYNNHKVLK